MKKIAIVIIICLSYQLYAPIGVTGNDTKQREYTYGRKTLEGTLKKHIIKARKNLSHPLFSTLVIRKSGSTFVIKTNNTGLQNLNQRDMQDVRNGNWVFVKCFQQKEKPLIGIVDIGAIILGTQDQRAIVALLKAYLLKEVEFEPDRIELAREKRA